LIKHQIIDTQKIDHKRLMRLEMTMGMGMMSGGNAFSINGKAMDINRIDEVVKALIEAKENKK
jgi:bilirubin oxidase